MTKLPKLAAAALALGLLVCGQARAQVGAQPAGDAVDPERLALAEKIYGMIGSQTISAMTSAMKGVITQLTKDDTGDAAHQQALTAALGAGMDGMMPKVMRNSARVMARDFTTEDLKGMLAFYQSPVGQDMLSKMPAVTRDSMRLTLSLMPDFMRTFETTYCSHTTCSDQEKQAFAKVSERLQAQAAAPQ